MQQNTGDRHKRYGHCDEIFLDYEQRKCSDGLAFCSEQWVRKRKREENGSAKYNRMCVSGFVCSLVVVGGGSESLSGHNFSSKELPSNV